MASDQAAIQVAGTRDEECTAGERDAGAEREETETEKGNRWFLERVRGVPGVVHVEPFRGKTLGEQSFAVYVRDGDVAAEYGVYAVEGEVYNRYPDAQLRVEILEQSDLPEASLEAPAACP